MTEIYHYPFNALLPDLARAGGGFLVTAGPLPWLTDSPFALAIFGSLAIAFAIFAISTLIRHRTTIEVSHAGISTAGPRSVTVDWDAVSAVDLRYFSTRRDKEKGWMQLRVTAGRQVLNLDSALDGFADVVARVATAAAAQGVPLSETTKVNLKAMGIEPTRLPGAGSR